MEKSHVKSKPDRPWTEGNQEPPHGGAQHADFRQGPKQSESHNFQQAGNNGSDQPPPWPAPQDIETALRPVAPMTREMLPELMAVWLCDIAYRMPCPLDFVVAAATVMTSSLLGTQARMHPKQFDSWEVAPSPLGRRRRVSRFKENAVHFRSL